MKPRNAGNKRLASTRSFSAQAPPPHHDLQPCAPSPSTGSTAPSTAAQAQRPQRRPHRWNLSRTRTQISERLGKNHRWAKGNEHGSCDLSSTTQATTRSFTADSSAGDPSSTTTTTSSTRQRLSARTPPSTSRCPSMYLTLTVQRTRSRTPTLHSLRVYRRRQSSLPDIAAPAAGPSNPDVSSGPALHSP